MVSSSASISDAVASQSSSVFVFTSLFGVIVMLSSVGAEFPNTTIAEFVAVPSSLSTTVEVQVSSSPVLLFSSVRRSVLSEPSSVPS